VHGTQEQAFFNGDRGAVSLVHLLWTPCDWQPNCEHQIWASRRALEELQRLLPKSEPRGDVTIVVRGDTCLWSRGDRELV